MSDNVKSADNQQGSPPTLRWSDPSETTRRAPFSQKIIEAYILGCLHDGTYSSNKRFRISQKGTKWLKFLKKLFKKLGYNSWIYKEGKDRNVYVIETLASFLNFHFNPLDLESKKEKIFYVRGFFDAEGGIPHNKIFRFYIQLVQSDKEKLEMIKKILDELEIKSGKIHNPSKRVDPNYWRMYIPKKSQERFVKIVKTWHPEKLKILRKRVKI